MKNRIAQEQMAHDDPDNPMRVFGDDVEARDETHVWSFSTPAKDKELEKIAKRLEGDELSKFDIDEGVIRPSDYLKIHFSLPIWKVCKHKYLALFRRKLKEAVMARHRETKRPVYVAFNQGALRIVYTLNDRKLMDEVFETCKESFTRIANRDLPQITRATPDQTSITDFLPPREESESEDGMGDL